MTDSPHGPSHNKSPPVIANRSSIDLSLELEHQLDSESLPPDSPGFSRISDSANRTSFDPHVLAHIVSQLRDSLTQMTQERDDLVHQLAASHSREAEIKDSLSSYMERCENLGKELETSKKKNQDDEEAISMLRSKVEESRRGLMRLQSERTAENKRMTLDLTNARTQSFAGPRSSKRASFTPLTGSGFQGPPSSFRRTSSNNVAETDPGFAEFVAGLPGSIKSQTLNTNENVDGGESITPPRRISLFAAANRSSSSPLDNRLSPSSAEIDSLKHELIAVRAELEETRHDLSEANEAREASESCVKALRDYIGQSGVGESSNSGHGLRLPPLPSDSHIKDVEPEPKPKSLGWGGLKLWRVDTSTSAPPQASASQGTPTTSRQSMDSHRSAGTEQSSLSPSTAVPLKNKLGALFARGSSATSASHPVPSLHQDEPILNGSDVSSSTEERSEPTSPAVEKVQQVYVHGLGEVSEGNTTAEDHPNHTSHEVDGGDMKMVPL